MRDKQRFWSKMPYTLPYCPSETPLIKHMSLLRSCMALMDKVYDEDGDGAFVQTEFIVELMNSHSLCRELWEQVRKDALEAGFEPHDPLMQVNVVDPYRYDYQND